MNRMFMLGVGVVAAGCGARTPLVEGVLDASPTAQGTIAFVNGSHIYRIDPDGSGLTQLTDETATDSKPSWDPDGARIVFSREGTIEIMQADGTGVMQVSANGFEPAWSPDGSRIAFRQASQIYVMNADGSGPHPVSDGPYDARPAWSPDGSQIAFERSLNDCFTPQFIYVINADGTNLHRLTDPSSANQFAESGAAWSPDGSQVAFWSFGFGLATAQIEGPPDITAIWGGGGFTGNASVVAYPDWSPDGQRLVFMRGLATGELWMVSITGTLQSQLTDGAEPAWSRGTTH